ncbi:MAG: alanine racemase [Lentisphaerae bacterium]|nr:alanine racemase [Lentisphaerota bacterium]
MAPIMYCNGSWVEVDVRRLQANAEAIRSSLGGGGLIAVIKADAYGHGLAPVAAAFSRGGVTRFATAYVAEAEAVRVAVPGAEQILVLGVAGPEDVPRLLESRITPMAVSFDQSKALSDAAKASGRRLPVHLKLDTGMGRLGFVCPAELDRAVAVVQLPGLDVQGVCTHFSMVEPQKKPTAARGQAEKFRQAVAVLEAAAGRRLFRHMSSSRAALLLPDCDQDAVRVGIALYGYGAAAAAGRFATVPVLSWKSRVLQVKSVPAGFTVGYYASYKTPGPTDLAILSCGYTDGYQRHLGNRGQVLIGGRRRPVVGRVSMNWIAADLGPGSGVSPGDEAVLIGEQGGEQIWADELARHCNTIAYEILTGISRQIERRYVGEAGDPE